jgi:hypothetical protein
MTRAVDGKADRQPQTDRWMDGWVDGWMGEWMDVHQMSPYSTSLCFMISCASALQLLLEHSTAATP